MSENIQDNNARKGNAIAKLFKWTGAIIYVAALIIGGNNKNGIYGNFSFQSMLIILLIGFMAGTMMIGFGEIIKLLDDIKQKDR